jgi:hypothetical protein
MFQSKYLGKTSHLNRGKIITISRCAIWHSFNFDTQLLFLQRRCTGDQFWRETMTKLTLNKSKFGTTLVASVLAITIAGTAFSTEAEAGKRHRGAIAAGVIGAIVGGAIVADSHRRHHRSHDEYEYDAPRRSSSWERHVARCYRAYRSYDERTDTYVGYDGVERRCRK